MAHTLQIQHKRESRRFVPKDFNITTWEALKPYLDSLLAEEPDSLPALEAYLRKLSELDAVVQEDLAWRYIRMTCNTQDKELVEAYQYFIREILPHLSVYEDKLNRKLVANPFFDQLDPETYLTYTRSLRKQIELFREENVPLNSEAQSVAQQYGSLTGAMSIEHEGKTYTLQQAAKFLEDTDRSLRQTIWEKVNARRAQDRARLDEIFDQLLALRNRIATNAGYDSYTRYKFAELGRFDYTEEDTLRFHEAVEVAAKPVYERLMEERRQRLGVDRLRPWDLSVDIFGDRPLEPFDRAKELIDRTVAILAGLKPELGEMIRLMDTSGYLDLESRIGKAPGGYNYPLLESGIPFIFMNATGTQGDVTTMLHESGHAIHAYLTNDIELNALKSTPSEVAELASMAMELLALDHYDQFYPDAVSATRAKKEQLLRCITILPWIATVDAFQQWLYDHPGHSHEERSAAWTRLYYRFHGEMVDWSGYEQELANLWQKQMHIYEVPFYYIEYAIAQLGAIAVWRNYREDPRQGLDAYLAALKLGYTKPIPEVYAAAGIKFDFSVAYMQESIQACLEAYEALEIPA